METSGYEIELAHDGVQSLEKAKATRYDLAILDISMPGLNGYELAAAIRKIPSNEHTFPAALTGWGADEDRRRSKKTEFNTHLTKPASMSDINKLLTSLMSNSYKDEH